MHVRLSLFAADPERTEELLAYLRDDFAPVVAREPDSRGVLGLLDAEDSVVLLESLWLSEPAMAAHARSIASPEHFARFFGATMAVEHYRVANVVQLARADEQARVRVVHADVAQVDLDKVLLDYEDEALQHLLGMPGLCTAATLASTDPPRAVEQIVFRDEASLVASRGVAAQGRADAAAHLGVNVRSVDEYTVAFSSAQWE